MVSSGKYSQSMLSGDCTEVSQLRTTQAFRTESGYQEDYSIRPFDVLPANPARNEAATLLQPREHHFHSRYTEAPEL